MGVNYSNLEFERIGHASVVIRTDDGRNVYLDPWGQVLGEDNSQDADIVFVTHDDMDHYDAGAIEQVSTPDTDIVVYAAIDTSDLDVAVEELAYEESRAVEEIDVEAVPAHNRSDGSHVDDNGDPFHAEREVIGLKLSFGETTVYYPSDTDFLDEHTEITADVFLPPIGGCYTMGRHEAAEFVESVGADLVLPVHYDTFEEIEANAEAFARDVETDETTVELF